MEHAVEVLVQPPPPQLPPGRVPLGLARLEGLEQPGRAVGGGRLRVNGQPECETARRGAILLMT
jgi:hypothetical protein